MTVLSEPQTDTGRPSRGILGGPARPERNARPVTPPAGRPDRRVLVLVASVALIGASIAAFTSLYSSAAHTTPAIVVVRPVAQGDRLTSADLGQVEVSVPAGVAIVPVDEASTVAGKQASVAIAAGSLLTHADLTSGPSVGSGESVVGVALKDGTFPVSGLSVGDQVMIVQTAAPGTAIAAPTSGSGATTSSGTSATTATGVAFGGANETGAGVLIPQAVVFAVRYPGSSSSGGYSLLVSIEVPSADAAGVATAAAAGQVGLVLLPQASAGNTGSTGSTGTSASTGSAS